MRTLSLEPLEPKALLTDGLTDVVIPFCDDVGFCSTDLEVTKTESIDPVVAGSGPGNLTYQVRVDNKGPLDATGVELSELITLPAGTTIDSITPSGSTNYAPANAVSGTWTVGNLAVGEFETLTVVVTVDATTAAGSDVIGDTATLTAVNVPDFNPDNNSVTEATSVVRSADLEVTKTESTDPVMAGSGPGNLTYQVRVVNNGPSDASGVQLSESITLPAGATIDSITPGGSTSYDPASATSGAWTVGDLAVGEIETLTVVITVDGTAEAGTDRIGDTVTVTAVNEPDPNPENDWINEATSVVRTTDLEVTKTESVDPVVAGSGPGNLTYQVRVANKGPLDAAGVELSESLVLPAGVTIDSIIPSGTTSYAPDSAANGMWTVGDLAPGSFETLTVVLTVDATTEAGTDVIGDTVTVTAVNVPDFNVDNNSVTEATSVERSADLEVTKTESIDPVVAGSGPGNLTYQVSVVNKGPSDATGVELSESITLPAGATIDSITPSGMTSYAPANATSGIWTVGDLAAGSVQTLSVVLTVDVSTAAGTDVIGNTATITEVNEPDPNSTNDLATETTSVVAPRADLSISKLDASDPVAVGAQLRYTVTVENAGPNDARNVLVTDMLPARVRYLFDSGGCVVDPVRTLNCSVGTIPAGETATFDIRVLVDASLSNASMLTNTASVASSTIDPNPDNNVATEDTTIAACLCDPDRFEPNDTIDTARDLGTGDQTHDRLTVHQPGNDDWYKWTSTDSGRLVVDIEFLTRSGDLDLQLYDVSGQIIEFSDTVTDDERVEVGVTAGEMVFIRVLGFAGAFNPDYTLSIDGPEPPGVSIVEVVPDPRPGTIDDGVSPPMVDTIRINFTEAVTGFDLGDLTLTRTTKGSVSLLPGSAQLTTTNNINWELTNLGGLTDGSGFYELVLTAAGSEIEDLDGNPLAGGARESWSTRPGDANEDRVFDHIDLIIVQIRGKYTTNDATGEPADWSQGDWNGDGLFNQRDIMLALQTGIYRQTGLAASRVRSSATAGATDVALNEDTSQLRAATVDALLQSM